jgi:hypothetical protein
MVLRLPPARPIRCRTRRTHEPAKVAPFDGVVERALAAFDQKTSRRKSRLLTALSKGPWPLSTQKITA